jgi:Voltage-dependent L-type calcium channel, IQ-associated
MSSNGGPLFIYPTVYIALQAIWAQFDPSASGFVGVHRLRELVVRLQGPLGHKNPPPSYMRAIKDEAWHIRERGKGRKAAGLPFTEFLTSLLHVKLGPSVRLL